MKEDTTPLSLGDIQVVKFRLTRSAIFLIHSGLKPCICAWAQGREFGSFPHTDFFRTFPNARLREGKFNQELMDLTLKLWSLLANWVKDADVKSHRVRFDPISISALGFFLRIATKQIRHQHIISPVPDWKRVARRVGHQLEIHRRRAVRSTKTQKQGRTYAALQAAEKLLNGAPQ